MPSRLRPCRRERSPASPSFAAGPLPSGLRAWAAAPLSALAAACRHLFGNPNPSAAVHAWQVQHSELTVVAWAAALIAVLAPLSVRLYRRKSL